MVTVRRVQSNMFLYTSRAAHQRNIVGFQRSGENTKGNICIAKHCTRKGVLNSYLTLLPSFDYLLSHSLVSLEEKLNMALVHLPTSGHSTVKTAHYTQQTKYPHPQTNITDA
jgi:hypothetical protein